MSMKPGHTTCPLASMVSLPSIGFSVTAAIFSPLMPTLRTASSPVSGSMTRPPVTTRSYDAISAHTFLAGGAAEGLEVQLQSSAERHDVVLRGVDRVDPLHVTAQVRRRR